MRDSRIIRTPLYEQLYHILSQLIISDEFSIGDQFLTEQEICSRFNVSRSTASKTLSKLVTEGTLEIHKGVGTFIRDPNESISPLSINTIFTNKTLAAGKNPGFRVIEFREISSEQAGAAIVQALSIEQPETMILSRRVRLSDGKPVIFETHYFRKQFYPGLEKSDIAGSIYDIHKKKYGISLTKMDEKIRSVNIDMEISSHLEIENGAAGFLMHFTPVDSMQRKLYFAEVIYRGDCFEFHNRLGPIQKSTL